MLRFLIISFQLILLLSITIFLVSNSFNISFDIGDFSYNFSSNLLVIAVVILIFLVVLMSARHGFFIKCYKDFHNRRNKHNDRFFRIINEVPTFLLVVIVFLVVFKPSF